MPTEDRVLTPEEADALYWEEVEEAEEAAQEAARMETAYGWER